MPMRIGCRSLRAEIQRNCQWFRQMRGHLHLSGLCILPQRGLFQGEVMIRWSRCLKFTLAIIGGGWVLGQSSAPSRVRNPGVLISLSGLDTPDSMGKDFAGDFYFSFHGDIATFSEVGGRLKLEKKQAMQLPPRELRQIRFRNGVPSIRREGDIWEANAQGTWYRKLHFDKPYSDFVPTFDGRWVLFNTIEPMSGRAAQAVVTDGTKRGNQVLLPWPEWIKPQVNASDFWIAYLGQSLVIPYEEFVIVYGQVSGRLVVLDPVNSRVRSIKLPWSGPEGEQPDAAQTLVEARVPKRLQVIPAPNDQLIFVWDQNLVGVEPEMASETTKTEGRDYRALAVNLETGDKRDIQVPKGLDFPMYSPDGLTLASLGEVFAQDSTSANQVLKQGKPEVAGHPAKADQTLRP